MKAVVFHKPKDVRIERIPDPKIDDSQDVILRVTSTAICGSDLHIYNGLFPQFKKMVLGHEFMGLVEDAGKDVQSVKKGDRVIARCAVACGTCWFCQRGLTPACEKTNPKKYGPEGGTFKEKGGGLFGYSDLYGGYDGGQAEYVRVPYADANLWKVPGGYTDEQVLFLTDILPTGWTGIEWAGVKGGETVAVFGCGPVGIMAQKAAWLHGAERVFAVDHLDYRLEMARDAARSETINFKDDDAIEMIRDKTKGRGVDVCVDAVGMEADRTILEKAANLVHAQRGSINAFEMCLSAVRRGGELSVLGVYGTSFDNFPVGKIFDKGVHLHFGQALFHKYTDILMGFIEKGKLIADDIITHRMPLEKAPHGYEMFNKKEDKCLKVVLTA
jgi:S-(hydroxymethyl)glutathione dehydrogenase / alcohol dehydrogenase